MSKDFNNGLVKALAGVKESAFNTGSNTPAEAKKLYVAARSKLMLDYMDFLHEKSEKIRAELQEKYKRKIRYSIYTTDETTEPCVVYYNSPPTDVKLRCTDIAIQSITRAANALFMATVLKAESDSRVFKKDEDEDGFYLIALDDCFSHFKKADISVKKK
jgi:hypothetical protein